ncbi:MAG: DUF4158 domain-containing protein [Legionellales bacterium]|nr:DUF4158 domain-containing protein [Legionellales bacterium]
MNDTYFLDSEETFCIRQKHGGKNQLAFAVLLKKFQCDGHFDKIQYTLDTELLETLSAQLNLKSELLLHFNWESRSIDRFKREIRQFYGYRLPTVQDGELFIDWLTKKILPQAPSLLQCREKIDTVFS